MKPVKQRVNIEDGIYIIKNFTDITPEEIEKHCRFSKMTINGNELPRTGSFECVRDPETGSKPILRCPSSEDNLATDASGLVSNLIDDIEALTGHETNIVKIQKYDNGNIRIVKHSDKILDLDENTSIFILRIGASRTCLLQNKTTKQKIDFKVENGDLLVMSYKANTEWTHGIQCDRGLTEPSYSMVFRKSITFLDQDTGYVFGKHTPFSKLPTDVDESKYLTREQQKNKMVECFAIDNKTVANLEIYKDLIENSIFPM